MSSPSRPKVRRTTPAASDKSRLLPLSIAGLVCMFVAVALGYGAWYLFSTQRKDHPAQLSVKSSVAPDVVADATPEATPALSTPVEQAPAGELPVTGGIVMLGGDDVKGLPARKVAVEPFNIAETEVTNRQYADFVRATNRKPPTTWKNGELSEEAANEPVTGVTWTDAVAYCEWLSNKLGATVRLPTEAEWERAARGDDNRKYPWGNEWNDEAAASKPKGRVQKVKSYPAGRSPFGAYDMAGNVWEWIADEARDETGKPKSKNGQTLRILKGGSAEDKSEYISATARYEAPASSADKELGFRYIVIRNDNQPAKNKDGATDNSGAPASEKSAAP